MPSFHLNTSYACKIAPARDNLPDSETFCKNKQKKNKEIEKIYSKKILLSLKMNFTKSVFYKEKQTLFQMCYKPVFELEGRIRASNLTKYQKYVTMMGEQDENIFQLVALITL